MNLVVVGINGSRLAGAVVRFASDEASLRGAELRLVYAWQLPPVEFPTDQKDSADGLPGLLRAMSDEGEAILHTAVAQAKKQHPLVRCVPRVVEGDAAKAILDEAKEATLIVLGGRPKDKHGGIHVGSVAGEVLQHASCPVSLVPHPAH